MSVTDQPWTLFDAPADPLPVRSSDPATSRAAARQLNVRARQGEVLRSLRHRAVSSTAEEVRDTLSAWGMRRELGEVRSRLPELADPARFDPPLVRRVGVRRNRHGKQVTTWALTAAGSVAAKELDG